LSPERVLAQFHDQIQIEFLRVIEGLSIGDNMVIVQLLQAMDLVQGLIQQYLLDIHLFDCHFLICLIVPRGVYARKGALAELLKDSIVIRKDSTRYS
jgi:hypothetical protein